MTIEEARKISWHSGNPKPLGELLDKGELNRSDLEWASLNAYNLSLRQAGQVILDWMKQTGNEEVIAQVAAEIPQPAIALKITLEEARATKWKVSPYQGQTMGRLVDTKQLSLKDLGWAVENAWDERVKQAAIALSLVRLQQAVDEPTPKGFMKVVSGGRSYAVRQQFLYTMLEWLAFGFILGGLCVILISDITSRIANPRIMSSDLSAMPSWFPIFVIIIFILLLIGGIWLQLYLLQRISRWFQKRIALNRQGQEGEERAASIIQQTLDGDWHLFQNVELPGKNKADIDSILVGPSGVWALEIKNYTGEYRNIGDRWEYRAGAAWQGAKKSPSQQANDNAARLGNFFKADGITQWVTPAVIWANPDAPLQVENPQTAVWTLERLPDELGNLWGQKAMPEENHARIVEKLTRLCEAQITARKAL